MILVLAIAVLLVVAMLVIRAAAKGRLDELDLDLADAWDDVEAARAERRGYVGELVPLLHSLGDALEPRERRVVDDLRREHLAAARATTPAATGRVEQKLMQATTAALDLAGRRADLAEAAAALHGEIEDASAALRDTCGWFNDLVTEHERTASSFPGNLVGGVAEHTAVRLGHEWTPAAAPVTPATPRRTAVRSG